MAYPQGYSISSAGQAYMDGRGPFPSSRGGARSSNARHRGGLSYGPFGRRMENDQYYGEESSDEEQRSSWSDDDDNNEFPSPEAPRGQGMMGERGPSRGGSRTGGMRGVSTLGARGGAYDGMMGGGRDPRSFSDDPRAAGGYGRRDIGSMYEDPYAFDDEAMDPRAAGDYGRRDTGSMYEDPYAFDDEAMDPRAAGGYGRRDIGSMYEDPYAAFDVEAMDPRAAGGHGRRETGYMDEDPYAAAADHMATPAGGRHGRRGQDHMGMPYGPAMAVMDRNAEIEARGGRRGANRGYGYNAQPVIGGRTGQIYGGYREVDPGAGGMSGRGVMEGGDPRAGGMSGRARGGYPGGRRELF